jgi:hypothetical protein
LCDLGRAGAKTEEYRNAGKSYGPPSAPVESIDELHCARTFEIPAVRPYFTIYTKTDRPDGARLLVVRGQTLQRGGQCRGTAPEMPATSAADKLAESIFEIEVTRSTRMGAPSSVMQSCIEPNVEKDMSCSPGRVIRRVSELRKPCERRLID